MSDEREVFNLRLPGELYRDMTRLSEQSGHSLNAEIVVAVGKFVKDKETALERMAKRALKDELEAMEEAGRKHDEGIALGASHETDIVRAARERLNNIG